MRSVDDYVVLAAYTFGWPPSQVLCEPLGRLYRLLEPKFPLGPSDMTGPPDGDDTGPRSPSISYVWTDLPKVV